MSRSSTPPSVRRVLNELQNYPKDPNPVLLQLGPINEAETLHWESVMRGEKGTAYEHGQWKLDIKIPDNYPNAPPLIRFVTPICHPNVNFKVHIMFSLDKASVLMITDW
jgi:peroxin-4